MEAKPNLFNATFTRPVEGASNCLASPEIIIHDRKWGIYATDCVKRLKRLKVSSLSSNANIIGAGKPIIKSSRFNITVLRSAYRKSRFEKALIKYSNPLFFAQGICQGFCIMLYFLKAI